MPTKKIGDVLFNEIDVAKSDEAKFASAPALSTSKPTLHPNAFIHSSYCSPHLPARELVLRFALACATPEGFEDRI